METMSQDNKVKSFNQVRGSTKVCIHVLREVRRDYRALRSARALVDAGFSVTVVDVETDRSLPMEEYFHGIRIKHIIMPKWHSARRFELWFFIETIQMLASSVMLLLRIKADIYHANELTALPAAFIASLLSRKHLIFEIYDLQFPRPETGIGFWRRLGKLLTMFQSIVLPYCDAIIATSPFHIQEITQRFKVKDIYLIRSVPLYKVVQKNYHLQQFLGLSSKTRIALYQGGIQRNRGLDKLIRAAAFLDPDIVIVLMGPSDIGVKSYLENLISSEGVSDRVKLLPPAPYEELLKWTVSADIGLIILPPDYSLSIRWCLPNKLFEYLMVGLPVLVSELDAIAQVIRTHNVGNVVSSLTPTDIAAAINTMLADQETLVLMSRNALEAAHNEFNWEKESQQLISLYHRILEKRR